MRHTTLRSTYLLAAIVFAALVLALALLAWNASEASAEDGTGSPTASPTQSPAATASPTATPAPAQVNATEADFSIASDPSSVATGGTVEFHVTNHGALGHEFVLIKTDNPPNALLYDDAEHKAVEDAPGQEDLGEIGGEEPFILPGHAESGSFDLTPGRYVLICNIPDHYKAGMFTAFTVGTVAPTVAPSPTVAPTVAATAVALPKSGGQPADDGFPWIWLVPALAVMAIAAFGAKQLIAASGS
jgi:uncharacterized cupredoxin-like copper-binding protein